MTFWVFSHSPLSQPPRLLFLLSLSSHHFGLTNLILKIHHFLWHDYYITNKKNNSSHRLILLWERKRMLISIKLITVVITWADNAKMLLETGRRQLLAVGKCCGEYVAVCLAHIRYLALCYVVFSWAESTWLVALAELSSNLRSWFSRRNNNRIIGCCWMRTS